MVTTYFSDREFGPRPRVLDEFSATAWGGIVALIQSLIATGALGIDYPNTCPDGLGAIGTNEYTLSLALRAELPNLLWPLDVNSVPPTPVVLDLIELTFQHVAEPMLGTFHESLGHHHLTFDRKKGQGSFRDRVNQILARNGLEYELQADGQITRLAPLVLAEALASALFCTTDVEVNRILESARSKFLAPDIELRREGLEKLWDAWERLKTVLRPDDKKQSTNALLDRVAGTDDLRIVLEAESRELTRIGNEFQIRHSEVNKTPIHSSAHIDYLFHRLFAMIQLLLGAL